MANASIYAMSEVAFERLTTIPMLKATGKAIAREGVDGAKKIAKESLEQSLNRYSKSLGAGATDAILEMNSEVATKFSQNLIDKVTINPDLDVTEGLVDAAAVALVTTGAIKSPALAKQAPAEVKNIARLAMERIPKNMSIQDQVNVGTIMTEKVAIEEQNKGLDPVFQESNNEKIDELNSAAKVAVAPKVVQEKIDILNTEINKELESKFPDVNKIAENEAKLTELEVEQNLSYGGRAQELTKEIEDLKSQRDKLYEGDQTEVNIQKQAQEEKKINKELKGLMLERQNIKNNINNKALSSLNEPLNAELNKESRALAEKELGVTPKEEELEVKQKVQKDGLQKDDVQKETKIEISKDDKNIQREKEDGEGKKDEVLEVTKEGVKPSPEVKATEDLQEKKSRKLGERALLSEVLPDDFKKKLSDKGVEYAVRGRKVTKEEAKEIAKVHSGDRGALKAILVNPKSDISGDTRTTLAVGFAEESLRLSNEAKSETAKQKYMQDAVDVFETDMIEATGQAQAVESKKQWQDVIGRQPELVVAAAESKIRKNNQGFIEQHKEDINEAQKALQEEVQALTERVLGLEKDIKVANKVVFGKKESKKIADTIRKIKTPKDLAFATPIPIQVVWNPMVETIALAVEATGNISEAIQKGLQQARKSDWYKGLTKDEQTRFEDYVVDNLAQNKPKVKTKKQDIEKATDKVYRKMEGGTKEEARKLVIDYFDEINEAGKVDDKDFQQMFAKARGQEYLSKEHKEKLKESAEKLNESRQLGEELESLYDEAIKLRKEGSSVDNTIKEIKSKSKAYKEALSEAARANQYVSDTFGEDHTISGLLGTFIQGNLLTPISQVTNVVANALWQPIRSSKNIIATGIDLALSGIGRVRENIQKKVYKENSPTLNRLLNLLPTSERTFDSFGATRGYIVGASKGMIEGLQQLRTGQMADDAYIREVSKALHPLRAMADIYKGLKGEEKLKAQQYVTKTLEATLGIAPEITFRLLNLGDKPFRRGAERARLTEIADIKGLKGIEKEKFLNFPDEGSADKARQAGLEATFQQDNILTDMINSVKKGWNKADKEKLGKWDKVISGMMNILMKTQMPYVKTPTNILIETIPYARPEIGLAQAAYYASKGDRRKSTDYLARATVGYMINAGVATLMGAGIMSLAQGGREDEDEGEKRKATVSEYRDKPAYYMNLDAMTRYMMGGDASWQEDDSIIEYKRFGILSSIAMVQAESYRGKSNKEIQEMRYKDQALASLFPLMKSSLEQSFLTGVNGALTALAKGGYEADRWLLNTTTALSAIAIPNTYAAITGAYDENIREIKEPTLKDGEKHKKEILNKLKSRITTDSGLPSKVTLWGEKVSRVPDGKSPLFSLFDLTKSKKYGGDFGVKLYELYDRTKDGDVLPSAVRGSISLKGNNVKLTPKLKEQYQIEVGQARKLVMESFIGSKNYEDMTDADRIETIKRIYKKVNSKKGYVGKTKLNFIKNNWEDLKVLFEKQHPEEYAKLTGNSTE
jgi:hypothetical protein